MRVEMYAPDKLYGFCEDDDGGQVFFHAGVFERGHWDGLSEAPSPIIGESVLVEYHPVEGGRPPRANRVVRTTPPIWLRGRVESFNAEKGWGFAKGEDGVSYYLHRSEIEDRRLPVPGQELSFYVGHKKGRPRACYVKLGHMAG